MEASFSRQRVPGVFFGLLAVRFESSQKNLRKYRISARSDEPACSCTVISTTSCDWPRTMFRHICNRCNEGDTEPALESWRTEPAHRPITDRSRGRRVAAASIFESTCGALDRHLPPRSLGGGRTGRG